MTKKQKRKLKRIIGALCIFVVCELVCVAQLPEHLLGSSGVWLEFALFLVPYLIAGYDVLARAAHGITHKQPFDEHLLMSIATIGAFLLVFFPDADPHMAEGAAVMLFYQLGTLFESYAVGQTRSSIAEMMDIAPDYANVLREGTLEQVDPEEVAPGSLVVCKPGERIPLDGVVEEGTSQLDTSALTGESMPQSVGVGSRVVSGCINMQGALTVRTTGTYEDSTVQRILELVENASEHKTRTEGFITRFARVYTPVVVVLAVLIAVISPLVLQTSVSQSIQSALVFLVVSCPCALVISVPLSFFGGIGAASKKGILVKGSSYLEVIDRVQTIAFDKTGTLTNGVFGVVAIHPVQGMQAEELLSFAAHAEAHSAHPIALSVVDRYSGVIDEQRIREAREQSGFGVRARIDEHRVVVGNDRLMQAEEVEHVQCDLVGTIVHVAIDDVYAGHIVIADIMKEDAREVVHALQDKGIERCIMLTGDTQEVAAAVADQIGVHEFRAHMLPQDKVAFIEELIEQRDACEVRAQGKVGSIAFVGDGINDAPVLMRADVGIAMGGMASDAALEAADIVIMDGSPSRIVAALDIARKTMRIVRQNIVFALAVKMIIMVLALPMIGISTMWLAVFGDVGVSVLAILNAMRCLRA